MLGLIDMSDTWDFGFHVDWLLKLTTKFFSCKYSIGGKLNMLIMFLIFTYYILISTSFYVKEKIKY